MTSVVYSEIVTGHGQPGETQIKAAIKKGKLQAIADAWTEPKFPGLDEGEASTLRAAMNLKRPTLILMDDRAGRATARELGYPVTGTAGIILAAKRRKLIPAVKPVFQKLLRQDFRISPELIRAVLIEAKER